MSAGNRSYWWRKVPGENVEGIASRAQTEIGKTVRGTAPNLGVRVGMGITGERLHPRNASKREERLQP